MSTKNFDKPTRAGKKWTDDDNYELLTLISSEYSIEDVATKLERTVGAIKTHLLKLIYDLLNQNDWTVEELSTKYKLSVLEISNYQEREDKKKLNPPQKRTTRSDTKQEEQDVETKRSFSSATKTRSVLIPQPKTITNTTPLTYEEKSLALLTEIRDSLKIIAAKK
jgi:leucyl aminopeptidase